MKATSINTQSAIVEATNNLYRPLFCVHIEVFLMGEAASILVSKGKCGGLARYFFFGGGGFPRTIWEIIETCNKNEHSLYLNGINVRIPIISNLVLKIKIRQNVNQHVEDLFLMDVVASSMHGHITPNTGSKLDSWGRFKLNLFICPQYTTTSYSWNATDSLLGMQQYQFFLIK